MAALMTFLENGDTVMGLDLAHGGHLTHGSPVNFSGQLFNFVSYHVHPDTGRVDFDEVWNLARKYKPKMIICGGSAYPRFIEFERFREVVDEVDAFLMADIAHIAGLIAAGVHPSCLPHAHVTTSTTHKTMRGPRGAFILCNQDLARKIDRSVFPVTQGGPLMHTIAAKAVAFGEALEPSFKSYSEAVVRNAQVLGNRQ